MEALQNVQERLLSNKAGSGKGAYSICSSHAVVIEAAMLQAKEDKSVVIIESTSNQVDQFGGYSGMKPPDFVTFIQKIAARTGFPFDWVVLGGDHLGPNAWQNENESSAMEKANGLVQAYAAAGYQKIHLDASMHLADDTYDRAKPLPDAVVARRVVELCKTAETAIPAELKNNGKKPCYIIGTEVPIPGGAKDKEDHVTPTAPAALRETVSVTRDAFFKAGLEDAWERVIGVVAQPGVEFGDDQVFQYNSEAARNLSHALDDTPTLVFEAHSTDYQTEESLRNMVQDHFCILKVGPALTFAWREALFSLAFMEKELIANADERSNLEETLEEVMLGSKPNYWERYYRGGEDEQRFKRRYSLSDRSRYYWAHPRVDAAVNKLFANMSAKTIPFSLVSQYMPDLLEVVRETRRPVPPRDLAIAHVRNTVCMPYSAAVGC
jgi:D-tagatose-1,6-bisphosphate aldolase subunit GatZ/KbaZ